MTFTHWQAWALAALLVFVLDVMGWIRDERWPNATLTGWLFARALMVLALYVLAELVGWP